jgi:hypothetical protein
MFSFSYTIDHPRLTPRLTTYPCLFFLSYELSMPLIQFVFAMDCLTYEGLLCDSHMVSGGPGPSHPGLFFPHPTYVWRSRLVSNRKLYPRPRSLIRTIAVCLVLR